MGRVIKNTKAYDSGDVEAFINGVPAEFSEITYNTTQEHQRNYTLGNDASSWSRGKKEHSASATIPMHIITPIERSAGGDLLSIKPFDINVTFSNEFNEVINDTLTVKFMDQGREVTGDMGLEKQYELFVLGISYNNYIL